MARISTSSLAWGFNHLTNFLFFFPSIWILKKSKCEGEKYVFLWIFYHFFGFFFEWWHDWGSCICLLAIKNAVPTTLWFYIQVFRIMYILLSRIFYNHVILLIVWSVFYNYYSMTPRNVSELKLIWWLETQNCFPSHEGLIISYVIKNTKFFYVLTLYHIVCRLYIYNVFLGVHPKVLVVASSHCQEKKSIYPCKLKLFFRIPYAETYATLYQILQDKSLFCSAFTLDPSCSTNF